MAKAPADVPRKAITRGTGYWRVSKALQRGIRPDRRTNAGRHLMEVERSLVEAMGGDRECSPQEAALIRAAAVEILVSDLAGALISGDPSLIFALSEDGQLLGLSRLAEDHGKVTARLANILAQLGMKRRPAPVPDLAVVLAEARARREAGPQDGGEGDGSGDAPGTS